MSEVIDKLKREIELSSLYFTKKPILFGGMAMEYYGMRQAGADIDLIICDEDYQFLALKHPDKRKDIWGDLGVVIGPFEIWRCLVLMDYDFYLKDAIDEGIAFVISLDRLLLTRVFAMNIPKYMNDLKLIEKYYQEHFTKPAYLQESEKHIISYKNHDGIIYGRKYDD